MTISIPRIAKRLLFLALMTPLLGASANAAESKASVLNQYESHGFQCLDISETINVDTLKSYTDLKSLDDSDDVHVCVRVDMEQNHFPGNKYVFVFDQNDNMKTYNQIASVID